MNKILRFLKEPYYYNPHASGKIIFLCLIIGVAILALFEPFNFSMSNRKSLNVLAGFGMILLIAGWLTFYLLPRSFRKFYDPEQWTIGKNIFHYLVMLLLVAMQVVAYNYFILAPGRYNLYAFFIDLVATFTIGIIPICIVHFIGQNHLLKRHLKEATELNRTLSSRLETVSVQNGKITLTGSTKDCIPVDPESIVYLEASGNYITVRYKEEENVKEKQLRATMKQLEEQLTNYPYLLRCHRAFIVNTNYIYNVSGNTLGYKLSLFNSIQEIPVSRTYIKALKEQIG